MDWVHKIIALTLDYCIENLDEVQLNSHTDQEAGMCYTESMHHMADSHMNAYIRLKLALTEETPISILIMNSYGRAPGCCLVPLNVSITLLHALHRRWTMVLDNLKPEEWERQYYHPGNKEVCPLWQMTNNYSWHCSHHAEHILSLRKEWAGDLFLFFLILFFPFFPFFSQMMNPVMGRLAEINAAMQAMIFTGQSKQPAGMQSHNWSPQSDQRR